jgi:hypothetical protein
MKHAGPAALDRLGPLLARLRGFEALKEKSPGTFYHRGRAFLHFHDDPAGMFADVRLGADFERLQVDGAGADELLRRVAEKLKP